MNKNYYPPIKPHHKLGWLEWLAIGLSLWLLFYPHPYTYLFAVVLCMPIIGLIINGVNRPSMISLVSISKTLKDPDYDVADFIDIPAWILLIRVILDFNFESFYSLIKVGSFAFVLLLILLAVTHKAVEESTKSRFIIYLYIIGNIALYSYAATYGINCVFDYSDPKVYRSSVVAKHVSRGKSTSYYLTIKPWGTHKENEDIRVGSDKYDETQIGQTVKVDYKAGLLGIPWYNLE
nr:hypothetical protein [uncultured Mucilaginibacter sp.]